MDQKLTKQMHKTSYKDQEESLEWLKFNHN